MKYILGSGYYSMFYMSYIWAAATRSGSPADARLAGSLSGAIAAGCSGGATATSRGAFEYASAVCSNISPYYLIHITEPI